MFPVDIARARWAAGVVAQTYARGGLVACVEATYDREGRACWAWSVGRDDAAPTLRGTRDTEHEAKLAAALWLTHLGAGS